MNVDKGQMEEKAVHSWSRLSSAGKSAFEEALRVFNPMSKDLTDTETQLVTFLQGLREEGYQPTILSSKDVYGYNSTTADTPPPPPPPSVGPKCPPKNTSGVSSRSHSKNQTGKPANPRVGISVNASKMSNKHLTRNSTNLLLTSLKQSDSEKTKGSCVGFPSDMYPGVFPAMKLSVVLEALVPFKAAASSLASLKEQPLGIASKQNAKGKNKAYQSLMKETNGVVLNGINGRILKENDACKAFQILNGRILVHSHPHCNGMTQTKRNSKVQMDVTNREAKQQMGARGKKRKLNEVSEEAPVHKRIQITLPLVKRSPFDKDKYNLLKSAVIKIDKTSSDDEVRRKAQQILRVNLSPVLRIQPLFVSLQ
ncbi:coiled-coil domain-containing protein 71 [Rhinoderma darwinii]|uniref:coiled-coil domain-containing protein 71 n=1 Tax=Rhinoderma darwinii TaxID=43563 RepID=UPI003F660CE1